MDCREVRVLLSEYVEKCLPEPNACAMEQHLSSCAECRAELDELSKTLQVIHALPRQEPVFDLWQEFVPTFVQVRAEMKPGFLGTIQSYFLRLFGAVREGWVVFLTVLFHNMRTRAQRPA